MQVIRRRRCATRWTRPRGRVDARASWWYYAGRWGLFCLCATRGRGVSLATVTHEGHIVMWPRSRDLSDRGHYVKKKQRTAEQAQLPHLAAVETNVLSGFMGIVNHCSITRYDDGDPRKVGWVTLKTYGSAWQLEAKDPDTCCRLTVVEASLDDALGLLNLLLESDEAPWEPDQWLQQQAVKSRKK